MRKENEERERGKRKRKKKEKRERKEKADGLKDRRSDLLEMLGYIFWHLFAREYRFSLVLFTNA